MKYFSFFFAFLLVGCTTTSADKKLLEEALRIHSKAITIDTHTDTPLYFIHAGFDFGQRHDARKEGSKVDIPRMEEGGLDALFLAVFIVQGERSAAGNARAFERADLIFDSIVSVLKRNNDKAEIAFNASDIERLKYSGKRAFLLGIENGYPIGNDLSLIKYFYDRGARYITLCHSKNNDICDSSTDTVEFNGLSAFGEAVVKEMNRIGMMIDVSHISDSAFFDVVRLSTTPVIASHSSARAICNNPRNFSDEMLKALAKNRGVIQVCLLSDYVKTFPPNLQRDSVMNELLIKYRYFKDLSDEESAMASAEWQAMNLKYPIELATVSDYVDHIDHIVKTIGIDHVGIGSDFDGGGGLADCIDVGEFPKITMELLRRGYVEEDIIKIWGGNFLRVMEEIQNKAG
ncbi:MAG TPA: dipeptidase [Bacteroidales bacterium]|jgi:membrane dipeptidase|nr:dipeptidase [Bacteroidales bacterium]NLH34284.1 membrane dipeptidase [Lentimicrobium sp.]MBP7873323.1 dipeptidase [Bacteroidales bacterium]HNY60513.1 dipeptidase [Bacteroidales bacterium]HOG67684.1 dipeptidase [Bacteroidales bacterium]